MDLHPTDVAAAAVISLAALDVMALRMRLRWRIRELDARRRYLRSAAHSLPAGSILDERRADGTGLRLNLGAGPAEGAGDDGA